MQISRLILEGNKVKIHLSADEILKLSVEIGKSYVVGNTDGGYLQVIPITGGTFTGEGLSGTIVSGGADWNNKINEKLTHVFAKYCIMEDDGTVISIENEGFIDFDEERRIRTVPRFEVCSESEKYSVLRSGVFVGELDATRSEEGLIGITIYKLD